jgi:hypothetical protein
MIILSTGQFLSLAVPLLITGGLLGVSVADLLRDTGGKRRIPAELTPDDIAKMEAEVKEEISGIADVDMAARIEKAVIDQLVRQRTRRPRAARS